MVGGAKSKSTAQVVYILVYAAQAICRPRSPLHSTGPSGSSAKFWAEDKAHIDYVVALHLSCMMGQKFAGFLRSLTIYVAGLYVFSMKRSSQSGGRK